MDRSFKKQVWQAVLRKGPGLCLPKPLRRAFGHFVLTQFLPTIEHLFDEPINFTNLIRCVYAYHRLMRDGGLLVRLTDLYSGRLSGGTKEIHLEILRQSVDRDVQALESVIDDPIAWLHQHNLTEQEVLEKFHLNKSMIGSSRWPLLTIGQLLTTRPQVIMGSYTWFLIQGTIDLD